MMSARGLPLLRSSHSYSEHVRVLAALDGVAGRSALRDLKVIRQRRVRQLPRQHTQGHRGLAPTRSLACPQCRQLAGSNNGIVSRASPRKGRARTAYTKGMCGRFTTKMTLAEIVAFYWLTMEAPPHNSPPRYKVCRTDPVDVIRGRDSERELAPTRWGLVPYWWHRPLKELRAATFNARAETVETEPFFRDGFKRNRCLIPTSGYCEWQDTPAGKQPFYVTARDGLPVLTAAGFWDAWKTRRPARCCCRAR